MEGLIKSKMEMLKVDLSAIGYDLYDHQLEGIAWMLEREMSPSNVKGGLLCDDPGLGKTIQTLSVIKANNNGGRQLIICPVSLMEQWKNVAKRVFPDVKIKVHTGEHQFKTKKEIELINPFITIASYNAVFGVELDKFGKVLDTEYRKTVLHSVEWERLILDECHMIRNKNTKVFKGSYDLKATYRWGLSGTPLQNKLLDLQNLFRFLHHSELSVRSNMDDLKATYIMRRNRHILPDAYKGLNIHIEDLEFSTEEERDFYHGLKDAVRKEYLRVTAEEGNHMSTIFELLLRLRQGTIHPSLVWNGLYRKYKESGDDDVDLKSIERKIRYWNKRPSTKMSRLVELFGEHGSDVRSLIFSHYTEESQLIFKFLKLKYPDLRIEIFDGSLSLESRNSMIRRAENGEIDCMIIQILCGGVGLNLQMFNKVYIVAPNWNPANEIQAIARCHRIGQKSDVDVVKLVIREEDEKSTIDEKILVVQQKKRELMAEHLEDETLLFNERIRGSMNLTMKDFAYLLK